MSYTRLHNWTPTIYSYALSQHLECNVWLKMECFQKVGSYKIRGIGHLCQHYAQQGCDQFVASSGGNAGVAVAYAGKSLGIPVTVFLPQTSHPIFVAALKALDATVNIEGKIWDEANAAALKFLLKHKKAAYIPPFDHPLIWEGHATMVGEVAALGIVPDAMVVSVGGGGLACGVLAGMQREGWDSVPLIAVETQGAAAFFASINAGQLVTLETVDTIATSLATKRITERLWQWHQQHPIIPLTVSDHEAALAVKHFVDDQRALVEVSSGAALAVLYEKRQELLNFNNIVVVVCGGIGISVALLDHYLNST